VVERWREALKAVEEASALLDAASRMAVEAKELVEGNYITRSQVKIESLLDIVRVAEARLGSALENLKALEGGRSG